MMKDLYQPVFWCGFALSLSALYYSSEQVTQTVAPKRKPVLMQISFGKSKEQGTVEGSTASETNPPEQTDPGSLPQPVEDPFLSGSSDSPALDPVVTTQPDDSDESDPLSAFLSAARNSKE